MSGSKSQSASSYVPTLSPEQNADIKARTGLFTNTIAPAYNQAVQGATDVYNTNAGGVINAAQNAAGTAAQAQQTLGSTGESALRTGIAGLESLYDPGYESRQLQAALMPAQSQYMQNLAGQQAQFGGAGQLGSARQALAGQQLAGMTAANQQTAAANIENQIAQQRMAAGQSLASTGLQGITGAQTAAQNQVTASMVPQQLYNQYASLLFGTPAASYTPDFRGTQSSKTTGSSSQVGFSL
jgi:hypothetical protein